MNVVGAVRFIFYSGYDGAVPWATLNVAWAGRAVHAKARGRALLDRENDVLTLYGISNCDTVKKARGWFDARGTAYAFHDYKKAGIDESSLRRWIAALGWEAVLNRGGTTFRKLPDADRAGLDGDKAVALMLTQPSMIKRPIVEGANEHSGVLLAGYKPEAWDAEIG